MPSIRGVEAYVAKAYQRQEKLRQELVLRYQQRDLPLEMGAEITILGNQVFEECLREFGNVAAELGSMRRLLGDLRHLEKGNR